MHDIRVLKDHIEKRCLDGWTLTQNVRQIVHQRRTNLLFHQSKELMFDWDALVGCNPRHAFH